MNCFVALLTHFFQVHWPGLVQFVFDVQSYEDKTKMSTLPPFRTKRTLNRGRFPVPRRSASNSHHDVRGACICCHAISGTLVLTVAANVSLRDCRAILVGDEKHFEGADKRLACVERDHSSRGVRAHPSKGWGWGHAWNALVKVATSSTAAADSCLAVRDKSNGREQRKDGRLALETQEKQFARKATHGSRGEACMRRHTMKFK
jgi:hypothetical protein